MNLFRQRSQKIINFVLSLIQIMAMMKEYMIRAGSGQDDLGELEQLGSQLSKVTTQDDLDQLNMLLSGFANLQIQKKDLG